MTQDLNQLVCFGAPPTAIAVPSGPGQLQIQFVRPMVARNEKSCGAYKPKFLDVDYADIHQPMGQTDKSGEPADSLQPVLPAAANC